MVRRNLYFKDGTLFSDGYERVVHGGRGDYVELSKENIKVGLVPKFEMPSDFSKVPFYYIWMLPHGREEKIYFQLRTVKYADYKVGFYYISPSLLLPFDECKELF